MVHRGSIVSLVDGDGGVDDVRLDSLLLDDRLDVLMDVVVNTLARDGGSSLGRVCGAVCLSCVSVLGSFSLESSPSVFLLAVVEGLMLHRDKVVVVLLRTRFVSGRFILSIKVAYRVSL
jgi:hypothetical protein